MKQKICRCHEFLSEFDFIARNHARKNRLPVVVHKLIHCIAETFVVEKIVKSEDDGFWVELDLITRHVDVIVVVTTSEVIAV